MPLKLWSLLLSLFALLYISTSLYTTLPSISKYNKSNNLSPAISFLASSNHGTDTSDGTSPDSDSKKDSNSGFIAWLGLYPSLTCIAPKLNVKHLDIFIQKKFLALQTKLSQGAETPFGARQGSASQVPFSSIVHSRDLVYWYLSQVEMIL